MQKQKTVYETLPFLEVVCHHLRAKGVELLGVVVEVQVHLLRKAVIGTLSLNSFNLDILLISYFIFKL
jgi:hypothetical protein